MADRRCVPMEGRQNVFFQGQRLLEIQRSKDARRKREAAAVRAVLDGLHEKSGRRRSDEKQIAEHRGNGECQFRDFETLQRHSDVVRHDCVSVVLARILFVINLP